ncbi:MAG: HEAT repeat domain-containing protein [Deltaproteobacteria bacterium]|nr:HEAT repeat domain-containing protein [Deltaproteobacteria bacterium]MCB9785886.1 HEAT repeat domain-containing protein [Deltaproteobacteria bacterium]
MLTATLVIVSALSGLAQAAPDSQRVTEAIADLTRCKDIKAPRCLEALATLSDVGPAALQPAAAALPRMAQGGQLLTISLLGADTTDKGTTLLGKAVLDSRLSPTIRTLAVSELTQRYESKSAKLIITKYLLEAATVADAPVRAAVVRALGNRPTKGDTRVLQALLTAANDADTTVRLEAVLGLGMSGDESVGPALVRALDDEAPRVRTAAADGLTFVKYAPAVRPLIDAIRNSDAVFRRVVGEALAYQTGNRFGDDYGLWREWYRNR